MLRGKREAEFLEHLEELRQRLIRCIIYIAVGTAATWAFRGSLIGLLQTPLQVAAQGFHQHVEFMILKPWEGFTLSINIALVGGIILSFPLTFMEAWLFVEPALEPHERKWVVPLLPAAFALFCSGVAFCYWLSPRTLAILLRFNATLGAEFKYVLADYLGFILKLMVVFGAMFELPLIVMFLSAVGIVRYSWWAAKWRMAIVLIAVIAAVVTPTPDAVTMSFLCGPMVGLYLLSLGLAWIVDKNRREEREQQRQGAKPGPAPAEATEAAPATESPWRAPAALPETSEQTAAMDAPGEVADTTPADDSALGDAPSNDGEAPSPGNADPSGRTDETVWTD